MRKNKIEIPQKRMTVFDIPSDEAKQYLKELIKTNARVGVEIIRSK